MKYLILLLLPFLLLPVLVLANETDIQKLISERARLETINSELQSEIRSGTAETDRITERILTLQDEIKETKRKLAEVKIKRTQFLSQVSSKNEAQSVSLSKPELEKGIETYEAFVKNGIPWDIEQRLDKIKAVKTALAANKEPLSESTLQWSQFLESERKLAGETQKKLRRLTIENVDHDAAIFRLGLTSLYYKTAAGQTGIFYRKGQRLFHQQISDDAIKNKIIKLVESIDSKNSERLLSELVLTPGMLAKETL